MNVFLNKQRKLREGWWVGLFFLVLAAFTFPAVLLAKEYQFEVTMFHQLVMVLATTWLCQKVRGGAMADFTGRLNVYFIRHLLFGFVLGTTLMVAPAIVLFLGGWVRWEFLSFDIKGLSTITASIVAGAITEEFLFRGFIFQRLRDGLGVWLMQIIVGAFFLLTHMGNPELVGDVKVLAMLNIFFASILFGALVIRTNNLTMAIGMHVSANWVQGTLLGFGVSGNAQPGILKAITGDAPVWLTGGNFGLEGSLPGLVAVMMAFVLFQKWKNKFLPLNKEGNSHRRANDGYDFTSTS